MESKFNLEILMLVLLVASTLMGCSASEPEAKDDTSEKRVIGIIGAME